MAHQPSRGLHLGVEGDHARAARSSSMQSGSSSSLAVAGLLDLEALELEVDPDEAADLLACRRRRMTSPPRSMGATLGC